MQESPGVRPIGERPIGKRMMEIKLIEESSQEADREIIIKICRRNDHKSCQRSYSEKLLRQAAMGS